MSIIAPILAVLSEDLVAPRKFKMSPGSRDVLMVFGAVLLVSVLALLWALFLRKKRRRHHHSHSHDRSAQTVPNSSPLPNQTQAVTGTNADSVSQGHHRKRRRRPRKGRPPHS